MRRRRTANLPATVATLALALWGCAADGRAPGGGPPDGARAAVQAFAQICGRLDRGTVLGEAGRFGFVPGRQAGVAPAVLEPLEARNVTLLVRRVPGSVGMLFWDDAPPHCELAVTGLDAAAVEREFAALLAGLEASPQLAVARATPEQMRALDAGQGLRLGALALVAPRALVPAPPRALSLRLPQEGRAGAPVAMVARDAGSAAPQGPWAPPAPMPIPPSQIKDAVR